MTWLLPIFFSLILLGPAAAAPVSGHVRLSNSAAPAVNKHQDYSGVVVWLEPVHPDAQPGPAKTATARMNQKEKQFVPHILAIQVGSGVTLPNMDPIYHSAFSTFNGQVFDLGLYPPGASRTVAFRHEGIVRVFCNIHPTMSAVIVVLKYPWFAVSDAAGAFTIPGAPPGEYQLHVFHERSTQETLAALERRVTVGESGLTLPPVAISESGYLEAPHKDKYGHDYAPVPDDHAGYPSGRK